MTKITFDLEEFVDGLLDVLGSFTSGVYGVIADEEEKERTGLEIGAVYHSYYGARSVLVKGKVLEE